MTGLGATPWAETLKARRSMLPWLTALGAACVPLVGGLFMLILKDPAWARRLGLITAKAQMRAGTADWSTYVDLLAQAVAVGGLLLFGLIAIASFGREWSDRTVKDLLALPTPRAAIAGAKFVVIAFWSVILAAIVYLLGVSIGAAVGLPGWSPRLALHAAGEIAATTGLTIALVTPFAWTASAGRGFLPPIGAMLLVVVLAQILAALGWGPYFPWSIPALASGAAGPDVAKLGAGSYLLVALTGIAGVVATLAWWQSADQP